MDIGERIKMLRTQQGLTLEEVGTRVGVGKSTVRKWESGQIANMRRDKIALLAKALNVTPTYLMGWKEESDPDTVYVADDSLKPLYENIKKYRKQAGLTQEELAKKAGYTDRSSIAKIESGHVDLTQSKIRQFAEIFGVTPSALMGLDAEKEARPALPDAIPYTPMPLVRVAGAVRCGPGGLAIEEDLGYERADVPSPKDYIYLRATGDSMAPQICEGDLALVHLQPDVESGELAVVVIDGEEGMLKRVIKREGALILQSFNAAVEPRIVVGEALNDVAIVGKVVQTVRKW